MRSLRRTVTVSPSLAPAFDRHTFTPTNADAIALVRADLNDYDHDLAMRVSYVDIGNVFDPFNA